jgi:putative lipoic acid-binding regulatory protein
MTTEKFITDLNNKPLILYPCEWNYRIIGTDHGEIELAVRETLGDTEYVFEKANVKGKFSSFSLTLTVRNESHRNEIYAALGQHPAVRIIM